MMKIAKIGLIFLGVVGLIVGIFFLLNRKSEGRRDVERGLNLAALKTEIDNSWKSLEGVEWTSDEFKTIYMDRVAKLNRLTKSERLSQANKNRLLQYNSTIALAFLEKSIYKEWKKSNCSYTKVRRHHNMLGFLYTENGELKNQKASKEIEECWSVYNQARALAFYDYSSIQPTYQMGGEWIDYNDHVENLNNRKSAILSNNLYQSNLSSINEIKNGLNKMDHKLNDQKKNYYDSLAKIIIHEWEDIYPTIEDRIDKKNALSTLGRLKQRYYQELGKQKDKQKDKLTTFYEKFREDVNTKPTQD